MAIVLYTPGTPIVFSSSGTGGAVLTPTSVTNGAGRISARHDRGAGAIEAMYEWHASLVTATAPTLGRTLRFFWAGANASTGAANTDGRFSETDQAISSIERLRNLHSMGQVQADINSNPSTLVGRGLVEIRTRYIQAAFWNDLNCSLSGTAADLVLTLTPVPDSF